MTKRDLFMNNRILSNGSGKRQIIIQQIHIRHLKLLKHNEILMKWQKIWRKRQIFFFWKRKQTGLATQEKRKKRLEKVYSITEIVEEVDINKKGTHK